MKQVEVACYDDLDWTEKEAKTPATHTLYVGLDGQWRELDLTEAHTIELAEFLARYMKAGHKPEAPPKPPKPQGGSSHYRTSRAEAIERNKAMAAFAEARGLKYNPATKTTGAYFPKDTRLAYEAHLETLAAVTGEAPDA